MVDATTKATVQKLPMLTVKAGPRDGEEWIKRIKEEYTALITYQKVNKEAGNEWFTIESNKLGTRWTGKVWYMHEMRKYEFDLEFELPVAYPTVCRCLSPLCQSGENTNTRSVCCDADVA